MSLGIGIHWCCRIETDCEMLRVLLVPESARDMNRAGIRFESLVKNHLTVFQRPLDDSTGDRCRMPAGPVCRVGQGARITNFRFPRAIASHRNDPGSFKGRGEVLLCFFQSRVIPSFLTALSTELFDGLRVFFFHGLNLGRMHRPELIGRQETLKDRSDDSVDGACEQASDKGFLHQAGSWSLRKAGMDVR